MQYFHLTFLLTFWVLPKAGKSKRFTVNQAETLVEAQTLNLAH